MTTSDPHGYKHVNFVLWVQTFYWHSDMSVDLSKAETFLDLSTRLLEETDALEKNGD
jgi:hypothetical protein